jgi:phosphatidylglycerophosphatase C
VTGAFAGANCRGPEKVRRLREAFGDDVRLEAAYGDTDGDKEMLALAEEQGMKVFNGTGRSSL